MAVVKYKTLAIVKIKNLGRPEDCPTGPDGKKKGPHWDHSIEEFRDLPATQVVSHKLNGFSKVNSPTNPST